MESLLDLVNRIRSYIHLIRNKSPAMPAIHTDRFKNTFFNRIVFKYNVAL